jgi:type I restriction enzyme S subunit
MSHYKPYPAYKDSGVEWLGQVPAHWEVFRIKSLISSSQNGFWGDEPKGDENDIPCARVADFDRSNLTVGDDLPTIRNVPAFQRESRQVCRGDLLFEKSGGGEQTLVGAVVHYTGEKPVICSNFVAVIKCKPSVSARWLCYANAYLYSVGVNIRSIKQATGIQNIDSEDYFSECISVPSEIEQGLIACYLDRETARIDGLIIRKNRFIELLREKRQALITHAVTKGLDPNAPMKDSGVEWLGDIPEHWNVKRLQYLCSSIKAGPFGSALTKDMYVSEGYRIYGQEQVIPNDFTIGAYFISYERYAELQQYAVETGDVLISCVGTFGRIAVVPAEIEPGIINPRLMRVRANRSISPEYLATIMRSSVVFEQFSMWSRGGTMDVINIGTLSGIFLALPPKSEQARISIFLDCETTRIDTLISTTESSIELLKERRSALITAAVTGQIDLRETV